MVIRSLLSRLGLQPVPPKPKAPPKTAKAPPPLELLADGRVIKVAMRRNARAKRYSLRVAPRGDGAVVTIPRRGTIAEARAFVERHRDWLAARVVAPVDQIDVPDVVPIGGRLHKVELSGALRGLIHIADGGGDEPRIIVPGEPAHARRRLIDYLKKQARRDFEAASAHHARRLGVSYSVIRLTDTQSRWGSASTRGTLSFSWRLVMAPPMVLDYLVAHEVAHLREMNHSDRFWALCEWLAPQTEEARAWLKVHGASLQRAL